MYLQKVCHGLRFGAIHKLADFSSCVVLTVHCPLRLLFSSRELEIETQVYLVRCTYLLLECLGTLLRDDVRFSFIVTVFGLKFLHNDRKNSL